MCPNRAQKENEMAKQKFNLNSLLNQSSRMDAEIKTDIEFKIEYISVNNLIPSEENFYDIEHIENLKQSIELSGGVKQNLIVTSLGADGQYRIIAGHRRHKASKELVNEGKKEYEFLPCVVENNIDSDKEQLMLIMTNSTTRELSDFEKTRQAQMLKDILVKIKKKENLPGRVREIIADILNTSPAQISRMESITKNLSQELTEEFKEQKIGISAAYELSKKPEQEQEAKYKEYKETGKIITKVDDPAEKMDTKGIKADDKGEMSKEAKDLKETERAKEINFENNTVTISLEEFKELERLAKIGAMTEKRNIAVSVGGVYDEFIECKIGQCPECTAVVVQGSGRYCTCGQKIDWED